MRPVSANNQDWSLFHYSALVNDNLVLDHDTNVLRTLDTSTYHKGLHFFAWMGNLL